MIRDGRVYWCDRHLDDPLGREVLDITELGFQDRPLAKMRLGSDLDGVRRGRRTGHHRPARSPTRSAASPRRHGAHGASWSSATGAAAGGRSPSRCVSPSDETRVRWTARVRRPRGCCARSASSTRCARCGCTSPTGTTRPTCTLFADDRVLAKLKLPVRPRLTPARRRPCSGATRRTRAPRAAAGRDRPRRRAPASATDHRGSAARAGGRPGPRSGLRRAKTLRHAERAGDQDWRCTTKVFSRLPDQEAAPWSSRATWASSTATAPAPSTRRCSGRALDFAAIWSYAGTPDGLPRRTPSWCAGGPGGTCGRWRRPSSGSTTRASRSTLQQAPGDHVHPDLARLGVQADGLRRGRA